MGLVLLSFALLSVLSVAKAQHVISLSVTPQPTAGASRIISPSFAGFGIEPSNLYSFTGGSQNNDLTTNLLNNLAKYTGVPPHIRVGGNTADYMVYDDEMNQYLVERNPNPVGQGNYATDSMIIGPRYFEVLDRAFPKDTPITFGLNLAYTESDYTSRITTMAGQALDRLTNVDVVSFEIGNEPDLYLGNGFRVGTWDGQVYTQQWLDRASSVWQQVLRPRNIGSNFFEPGCTASTIGTTFQISDLDSYGITERANSSSKPYISQWNQHDYYYYIGVSTYPLTLYSFMTLSTTNDQFAAWITQIQQAEDTRYPYALREMGVVGPIGLYGITDVFGAALWSLNFFLYAATLNITMVGMHMTDNSNASAWQPIGIYGNQPFVRPNYYAFAAFDMAIGPTCQAQVGGYILENQPEGYGGRSAAYSIYQDGTLASIVLINSNPANISDTKATLTFDLTLGTEFAGKNIYLAYLTNDGADARSGTTFNGISYEESGDGTPTQVDSAQQTVRVGQDGTVSINVRDTQAVVANIGSPVGQRKANASACSALAKASPGARSGSSSSSSASASSSSNAASSMTGSRTGSTARATTTSGVMGISSMITVPTMIAAFMSGFVLLCI